eukprot:7685743-Pyramimonas_sp.AAC.1
MGTQPAAWGMCYGSVRPACTCERRTPVGEKPVPWAIQGVNGAARRPSGPTSGPTEGSRIRSPMDCIREGERQVTSQILGGGSGPPTGKSEVLGGGACTP